MTGQLPAVSSTEQVQILAAILTPSKRDTSIALLDRIKRFEEFGVTVPQTEVPLHEEIVDGLYRRIIKIPMDTVVTGVMHKKPHMDYLTEGTILLATPDGMEQYTAPAYITTPIGTKKFALAVTPVTWSTCHATSKTTVEEARDEQHCLTDEEEDFYSMLADTDYTSLVNNSYTSLPNAIYLAKSTIHGVGLFAAIPMQADYTLTLKSKSGWESSILANINHSSNSNCTMQGSSLLAKVDISIDTELTLDYRELI